MQWILSNLVEALVIAGLALLVIEVVVLGFSTFILFFIGLASLLSAGLLHFGFIGNDWQSVLMCLAITTTILSVALWTPLKKLQSSVDKTRIASDFTGYSFILLDDVSPTSSVAHHYSGIAWKLKSKEHIKAGTWVEVVKADVGEFHIRPRYDL